MTKGALVIGGSVAGLQAALDLAESGIHVHLVDESPFLSQKGISVATAERPSCPSLLTGISVTC